VRSPQSIFDFCNVCIGKAWNNAPKVAVVEPNHYANLRGGSAVAQRDRKVQIKSAKVGLNKILDRSNKSVQGLNQDLNHWGLIRVL
jgi:hypothetical protein